MNPDLLEIKSKIASLQEAILTAHPDLPGLLRAIHTKLKSDPVTVTLLEEEDIAILISGLKLQTGVELNATTKKPSTPRKPSASARLNAIISGAGLSSDDF